LSLINARESGLPATLETDICIVGAGAAGITLAASLLDSKLDICLLESGGLSPDAETQSLYDLENTGYAPRPDYMARARYWGGSCNLWAGRSMRLMPLDFEPRDWVPYSGWPLTYEEVEKYYPAAERILGLPDSGQLLAQVVPERQSEDERLLFRDRALAPTFSLWARKPRRFGPDYRSRLARAGNVRAIMNLSATKLRLDDSGTTVSGIEAHTLDGARHEVRARTYVLACGGIENARLLLVSRDKQPDGIGNQGGLVGRFFMDHPRAVFGRVHVPEGRRLTLLRGRPVRDGKFQLGIGLSPETQRRERMLNHYVTFEELTSGYAEASYQSVVETMKVVLRRGHAGSRLDLLRRRAAEIPEMIYLLSPKELMPHAAYRAFVAMRDALPRRRGPKTFVAVYFCEQPPMPTSRVTLSERVDRFGVPLLKLHWDLDDTFVASVLRMQELLAGAVERSSLGRLEPGTGIPAFTDASHHMGTTRMSASGQDGVVDTNCRVHGVRNLHLAGSSVFPCAGHANPTLTIVALALRLADTIRSGDRGQA
jgi:choline dehydrogenase-like flavoprotein